MTFLDSNGVLWYSSTQPGVLSSYSVNVALSEGSNVREVTCLDQNTAPRGARRMRVAKLTRRTRISTLVLVKSWLGRPIQLLQSRSKSLRLRRRNLRPVSRKQQHNRVRKLRGKAQPVQRDRSKRPRSLRHLRYRQDGKARGELIIASLIRRAGRHDYADLFFCCVRRTFHSILHA